MIISIYDTNNPPGNDIQVNANPVNITSTDPNDPNCNQGSVSGPMTIFPQWGNCGEYTHPSYTPGTHWDFNGDQQDFSYCPPVGEIIGLPVHNDNPPEVTIQMEIVYE